MLRENGPTASEGLANRRFCCELGGPFVRHRVGRVEYASVWTAPEIPPLDTQQHRHANDVIARETYLHPILMLK